MITLRVNLLASILYAFPIGIVILTAWFFSKYTVNNEKKYIYLAIGTFIVSLVVAIWGIPAIAVNFVK